MATAAAGAKISFRRILIATDLSECSEHALQHGLGLARQYGSAVHFVHVVKPASHNLAAPDRRGQLAADEANNLLSRLRGARALEGLDHRLWVLEGEVLNVVSRIVRSEQIDLVVIGTHGRSGLRKLLLGSVAEEVFRNVQCPVLTVGPCTPATTGDLKLKHVLLATDFSTASTAALPYAVCAAHDFGAQLTILHVIESLQGEALHDRERVYAALRKRIGDMLAPFQSQVQQYRFEIELGWPSRTIVDFAQQREVDLIVLGLKPQHTFIDRLPWLHAYSIVCQACCPVLTVRGHSAS